jgi:hypothetical protein
VLIWLFVLGIAGAFGYAIYQRVGNGYLEQDAAVLAGQKIRQAYTDIQRGLTIPDAHYLAPYAPNMHKRALTEVDMNRKTEQLRGQDIHCNIEVLKVEPKVEQKPGGLPTVNEVRATIRVHWHLGGTPERVSEGIQIWRLNSGGWKPTSWELFGNLPLTFERWAGDDQIMD